MKNSIKEAFKYIALSRSNMNLGSVISLGIIVFYGFIALFAYTLAPDNSFNANQMHLSIHSKPPGFTTKILLVPNTSNGNVTSNSKVLDPLMGTTPKYVEIPFEKMAIKGDQLLVFSKKGLDASPSQKIPLNSFFCQNLECIKAKNVENRTFWFGTDKFGRDMLSRLLIGSRISFSIGFVAVTISLILGICIGAISGYFGGWVDSLIVWLMNILWSIPTLLLVIAITLALGKGLFQVYVAVGLTMWVEVARVVRGQVLSVKERQFVTAGKVLGFSSFRLLFNHVLPNCLSPVIVIAAANFASAILIESGLSFLGIGAQPPIPSWGSMIKDHYPFIILGKAYMAIIPGIALMSLVMSFMILGNGLRDLLSVKK